MTLPKVGRILVVFTIIILLSHYLPDYYWLKFASPVHKPIITYSPVLGGFIIGSYKNDDFDWRDEKGNILDRKDYELYTPGSNYRQLIFEKKMPDSINGIKIDFDSLRLHRVMARLTPQTVTAWQIPLWPLLESASGRIKLEMPDDYFRIKNSGIEFIDAASNKVDKDKSKVFTESLNQQGFTFPAKLVAGNPSTMKPFDEGYFILDSEEKLYHLKMVKSNPFVKLISYPSDIKIKHIIFQENTLKRFYGFAVADDGRIFYIMYDNYKFVETPVKGYDWSKHRFVYMSDYLNKNLLVETGSSTLDFVLDDKFNFVRDYGHKYYDEYTDQALTASKYLFPFTFSLFDSNSGLIDVFIEFSDWSALIGMIISAAAALFILRKRKAASGFNLLDIFIVLLTGIYGLIAVVLIKNID